MKPYYQDQAVTIYHGDCREILPGLEPVDLLLTDPPYGIGAAEKGFIRQGKQTGKSKTISGLNYVASDWDAASPSGEEIHAAIKHGAHSVIWGGNFFAGLPPSSCWLVWDKDNGDNRYADCELAWTNLKKAVRKIRYRWMGMLQEDMKHKEERVHPTQKPLAVMKWAISQAPEDVATILDPYMGSGTTLRAAKDLGRRAIGIEINERYCEEAAKRMGQEVLAL